VAGRGRNHQFGSLPHSRHWKAATPIQRPDWSLATASDLGLFRDLEGVIDRDSEVPHRRFELRVAEQR
jgi:hypothetical protein